MATVEKDDKNEHVGPTGNVTKVFHASVEYRLAGTSYNLEDDERAGVR
jgi:hypothetical protein